MGFALKWSRFTLDLDKRTHVMGVLNVTPDSFSDGGVFFNRESAVARGREMAREGADIIDVGGESTRPFSGGVSSGEEIDRVVPVIRELSACLEIPISIDTTKSEVAEAALEAGASMINDISALRFDPELGKVAAVAAVPVVLMHMQGRPETMQEAPRYENLIGEIKDFLQEGVKRAISAGISEELLILDPGIGFGKTFDHNFSLINRFNEFCELGKPLLAGPSRKSFIGRILDVEPSGRVVGSVAAAVACVLKGARIVRMHDVAETVDAVRVIDSVMQEKIEKT
jgi:dihydropteroate synthase